MTDSKIHKNWGSKNWGQNTVFANVTNNCDLTSISMTPISTECAEK